MTTDDKNLPEEQSNKVLSLDRMNQKIIKMEYAVRGKVTIRAKELQRELKEKKITKPFNSVVFANIGDPQALGQLPITFLRQVDACCICPALLDTDTFPCDVKEKAKRILAAIGGGGVGSYSDSQGPRVLREDVARYISERDGVESSADDVFLCAGATDGVKSLIHLLNFGEGRDRTGILIPIPQYPLYSATIAEMGLYQVNYYLDESRDWALNIENLKESVAAGRKTCKPRAIVVINPGNPTGQCLPAENIREIIQFCIDEHLIIIADEVYQENVYTKGMKFFSFRRIANEMGLSRDDIEIASLYSASKGFMGECGFRAGYVEMYGFNRHVQAQFRKHRTANLCSSNSGQVILNCIVNCPKPGDVSYELFAAERKRVLESLTRRAHMISDAFNRIDGIQCNRIHGAMYAFPSIRLPRKAIEKAQSIGQHPDLFYSLRLLEETGICVVPGSGFGQREGTYHVRMTILPPVEEIDNLIKNFEKFHINFINTYKDQ